MSLEIIDMGLVDYNEALTKQMELVKKVQQTPAKDYIIFCSHPVVVTLGRSSQKDEYKNWRGQIVTVSRGGKATYHGPSQLVIYPIFNLARQGRKSFKPKDLHSYLRALELYVITALKELGLNADARTQESLVDGKKLSLTGVWVGDKKIASIGIAVQKWVSYHGISINIENDPQAYADIKPCGFNKEIMTSVEALLGDVDKLAARRVFSEVAVGMFS